ncbi:hypothetical protein BH23ACT10_BH23ACT10_24510 [soil metagenome]
MQRWRRALVTGASSGIGDALARRLAADGTALVAVARDEARLTALRDALDVECQVLVADLAADAALERVADRLRDDAAPVDLLLNNAGLGFVGPFHSADPTREATVVDVNLVAVHRLAQAAASAFREAWHRRWHPQRVVAGCLHADAVRCHLRGHEGVREQHVRGPAHGTEALWHPGDTEEVAAAGLAGVAANRPLVIPGRLNRMSATFVNALPAVLRRAAVARMSR